MRPAHDHAALYPDYLRPIAGGQQPADDDQVDLLREQLLLGYYNTARAYWGDLEHWRDWCWAQTPAIDPLQAQANDVQGYLDWLAGLDYSPNTRARRLTTLRAFYKLAGHAERHSATLHNVRPVPRRRPNRISARSLR